ncbi:hypothetical protein [Maridesulfovibrio salexigens]|uniref:Uncharacterized protein n=1 Tax=Maridesulfovibrio salexigens (strain ATCC 14822 / DSM 2638 / NCIMB 8403 / VKM B-1763) TaxID=526222 RepID=C6BTD5_MARSD|nr:hypothetical protein [Maridesulfovibrio salexigens]ACS81616.1 hypothetical protein Desal_3570 [Maridesulfovibrio salexigens DSM 2638]
MNGKVKKIIFLFIGLAVFASLGTYAIYSIGGKAPRPVLSSGYKFSKGISLARLEFSNGEIIKLNRSFWENREVLKKAVLTVAGQESDHGPKEMTPHAGLKFSLELTGKSGMTYSPENVFCKRGKLVDEISRYVVEGARILASYEAMPEFKDREVEIVDM